MPERFCECCERVAKLGEAWTITRDGDDLCPECYDAMMAALQEQMDRLPKLIGLCPQHAPEFYTPLDDAEDPTCPRCSLTMVVYGQVPRA